MEGWVKVYRSVLDHWVWNKKPFSKGQAWVDLILLANHQEIKDFSNGSLRVFSKGTVNRSIESLSERWGWDRRKTKRFLNALQVDGMVNVNSTTNGTTITLENYSSFQDVGTTNGASNGTTDAQPIAQRVPINKNVKNVKNDKKENSRFAPPSLEDVRIYCSDRNNSVDPQRFIDFYESKGWMVGKNKMKDWKAAVRTWEQRDDGKSKKEDDINARQRENYGSHWTDHIFDT